MFQHTINVLDRWFFVADSSKKLQFVMGVWRSSELELRYLIRTPLVFNVDRHHSIVYTAMMHFNLEQELLNKDEQMLAIQLLGNKPCRDPYNVIVVSSFNDECH